MKKTNMKAMAIATASILSVSMMGAMSSSAANTITNGTKSENITYSEGESSFSTKKGADVASGANTLVKYYATDASDEDPTDPNRNQTASYTITVPATVEFGESHAITGASTDSTTASGEVKIKGKYAGWITVQPSGTDGEFTMSCADIGDMTAIAKIDNGNGLVKEGSVTSEVEETTSLTVEWKNNTAPLIGTWTGYVTYTVTKSATAPTSSPSA